MSEEKSAMSKRPTRKAPDRASQTATEAELQTYVMEAEEDKKALKISYGVAIVLHIILLLVNVPSFYGATTVIAEKPKVYVVQQLKKSKFLIIPSIGMSFLKKVIFG